MPAPCCTRCARRRAAYGIPASRHPFPFPARTCIPGRNRSFFSARGKVSEFGEHSGANWKARGPLRGVWGWSSNGESSDAYLGPWGPGARGTNGSMEEQAREQGGVKGCSHGTKLGSVPILVGPHPYIHARPWENHLRPGSLAVILAARVRVLAASPLSKGPYLLQETAWEPI